MAGIRATVVTPEVATGTSLKTILQITAPANQRLVVKEWAVSMDGQSNTNGPVQALIVRQTTAGTMSALTPRKMNQSDQETLQATALQNATVEQTTTDTVMALQQHPQGGFHWQARFGDELVIQGGERLALQILAGNDVNAIAMVMYEE